MTGSHRTAQANRTTTAGLIALSVATLLLLIWAMFPRAAYADQTIHVSQGSITGHDCDETEWHFIITGLTDQNGNDSNDDEAPATITVTWANGDVQNVAVAHTPGGTAHYHTTANLNSTVTDATATIYDSWSGTFVISHGPCPTTTTTTTTGTTTTTIEPTTTTTIEPTTTTTASDTTTTEVTTTSSTTTAQTTTSSTTTTSTGTTSTTTSQTTGTTTSQTTGTTSTTTTVPGPSTSTTSGTTSTTTPPPPPPPTTSTTTSPTVGPTSVEPTEDPSVSPTTVQVGGTAFTGPEDVVPLGAIALLFLTLGSGLLWAGNRLRASEEQS